MKKALCLLIVLAMLVAMAPSVFATEGEEVTQVLLDTTATTTTEDEAYLGVVFNLESPGTGTITVNFFIDDIYPEYQVNVADGWGEWINTAPVYEGPSTMTWNVGFGDAIQISVATMNAEAEYVLGSVDFEVVFTGVIGEGGEEEEPNTELVAGMNTVKIESGSQLSPQYTFTPETDGVLSLEAVTLVCVFMGMVEDWTEDMAEVMESVLAFQVDGYDYLEPVAVTAGVPVIITMTQGRMYANSGYGWEVGLELTVQSEGGEEEEPEIPEGGMILGNNTLEAASGNQNEYTFVAPQTGTLYITIRNWAMNSIEYGEQMLDYAWSQILVNGTAMTAMTGTLEVTAGDEVTFVITSDGDHYVSNVFLSMEGYYEEPLGSEYNPVVLTPDDVPVASIEIPAGEAVWYKLDYEFYDYELRVYGEDAYIISYGYDYSQPWPYPLVPTYHYAVDGMASYKVEYSMVMIGNAGTEAATFEIDGYLPKGLSQNPDELVIGEQTVFVEFEQYAYYIEWIAPEDGTLTLVFSGNMWRYDVCNVANPDNWSDDGPHYSGRQLTEGDPDTVSVEVKAGDLIRINVGCSNEEWDLPAGYITINASFAPAGGAGDPDEPIVVENPIVIGDNVIELPRGAEEASVYNFVATETGTLYFMATDFLYSASWTEGYVDNNDYMTDWTEYTIFSVNGEAVPGGFYGSVEVVAGQVYTFTWEHNGSNYGFQATMNLSYSDELIPVIGLDIELRPDHLPMNTVEIGAGEQVLYTISWEFSGYVLRIYGENAYIYYETYDWWSGESITRRIDAVDGVVDFDIDVHGTREFYIGNAGTEATSFEMDVYAPQGGINNPYIIENLEEVYVFAEAGMEFDVYFQWVADKTGTISVIDQMYSIRFYNVTKDENGTYDSTWTVYSGYVEAGDVLQISVSGYAPEDMECILDYTFEEGYRQGTEQNPIETDLMAGLDVDFSNKTLYYVWTPAESMTIVLDFSLRYDWSTNVPAITINGEPYTLGDELTVTAGEAVIIVLTSTRSVYGILQATKVGSSEPEVLLGDVNGDGVINYLDAMLVAQFYVGDIDETGLNMAAADVNADGTVNYLDAMLIAQFYVGDIDSFEP